MQSPDWSDLPFVAPAAFGRGRDGHTAMFSVIHYTAGSERSTSAEDGASYDTRRTDGTSCHYFHDSNSTVQCVRLGDRANSCFHRGNRLGIQHELCGTQQTRVQWLDPASRATIRRTAAQIVRDHTRLGIPFRRLTPAQVRACWYSNDRSIGGICGHGDVTLAFPEDNGSHTDPGAAFPWDVLLADIEDIRNGGDDMAFMDDPNSAELAWRTDALFADLPATRGGGYVGAPDGVNRLHTHLVAIDAATAALDTKVSALSTGTGQTPDALKAMFLQVLNSPEGQAAITRAANAAEDS